MNQRAFSRKRHSRVSAAFVLTIALAGQTLAQTTEVRISIGNSGLCDYLVSAPAANQDNRCRFPISVAYDEQDQGVRRACWKEKCDWVATIDGALLEATVFSLRIPGRGRTRCRSGRAVDAWHMAVRFAGPGGQKSRNLKIVSGNTDLSDDSVSAYVRELGPTPAGDVRCHEQGILPETLSNVQLDIENVRLQVFPKQTVGCAVIVDDLLPRADAKEAVIGPKELVAAMLRSDIEARGCHAPTVTVVEPIEKRLRTLARSFRVTVEK
jgi:hypothetical protein